MRIGPRRVRAPCRGRSNINTPKLFNHPRSSIKPGSAPDQKFRMYLYVYLELINFYINIPLKVHCKNETLLKLLSTVHLVEHCTAQKYH